MKAAVFYEPKHLQLENRPSPKVGPGDVLVQISACGVCGTDLHIFDGEAKVQPPVIMGHEYAGTIVEVGAQVTGLQAGDHVAIDPNIACGHCLYCRKGLINLCQNQEIFYKELTLVGSILNPFTFQKAVNLLAEGKVSVEDFAMQRFHLR